MKREDFIPECAMRIASALVRVCDKDDDWIEKVAKASFKLSVEIADFLKGPGLQDPDTIECKAIGLSVRSRNVLAQEGIRTLAQLVRYTPEEVAQFRNAGVKTVEEIQEKLAKFDLSLKRFE